MCATDEAVHVAHPVAPPSDDHLDCTLTTDTVDGSLPTAGVKSVEVIIIIGAYNEILCISSSYVGFCRFGLLSIIPYSVGCRKWVVDVFVVRRSAPPSNCDITIPRMTWKLMTQT